MPIKSYRNNLAGLIARPLPVLFAAIGVMFLVNTSRAQTTTVFDILVATGNLTVVGTTTVQGAGFSVGTSSFVVTSAAVGIGTTSPVALLHLVGTSSNKQFQWNASSASLRAGGVSGNKWSQNLGLYSIALGFDNVAEGQYSAVGGGLDNTAYGYYSVIGGGQQNTSGVSGQGSTVQWGTIAGGRNNVATGAGGTVSGGISNTTDGDYSVIAGGNQNAITSSDGSVIGGGGIDQSGSAQGNSISLGYGAGTIAGGLSNQITGNGQYSSIGGGRSNSVLSDGMLLSSGAVISGGVSNTARNASAAAIGGGANNTVRGDYATVPGGKSNSASGRYSLAAGQQASVSAQGSFVWADSLNTPLMSNTTDEFRIRASGGIVLLSSPTVATIIVSSGAILISTSAAAASAVPNIFISSVSGNVGVGTMTPAANLDVNGSAQFGTGATKSTFTAAGLLKLTSSGIQWADGTTSTSASAGGGAGNVVLTATQTFSGGNVFSSSITVGATVWTSSANTDSGVINGWSIVAATSPAGSSTVHFYGLAPGARYKITYRQTVTSTANLLLRFNGDAGTQYNWEALCMNTVTNNFLGASGTSQIYLIETNNGLNANSFSAGELVIDYMPSDSTRVTVRNNITKTAATATHCSTGGDYDGGSPVTSLSIGVHTGTFTGKYVLWREQLSN